MRIAALYDIHGNLPALEAVLEEVAESSVDRLLVGGDVMPGPYPGACLDALSGCSLPVDFIHGNGEREVLAALAGQPSESLPDEVQKAIKWTGLALNPFHVRLISGWPGSTRMTGDSLGSVFFCHATPENDTDIFTRDTPAQVLEPLFRGLGASLVLCGHTHMRFDRMVAGVRVVNPGSVGMPFGEPGAYWAILDRDIEFRRTDYDRDHAAQRIRGSGYPGADAFADQYVLNPPKAAEMLRIFNERALS